MPSGIFGLLNWGYYAVYCLLFMLASLLLAGCSSNPVESPLVLEHASIQSSYFVIVIKPQCNIYIDSNQSSAVFAVAELASILFIHKDSPYPGDFDWTNREWKKNKWCKIILPGNKTGWVLWETVGLAGDCYITAVGKNGDYPLYDKPNGAVIAYRQMMTPAIIEQYLFDSSGCEEFYKVRFTEEYRPHYVGWVRKPDINLIPSGVIEYAARHFAGWYWSIDWGSCIDYELAMDFYEIIDDLYSENLIYEEFDDYRWHVGGVTALEGMSGVYQLEGNYDAAIAKQMEIIARYAGVKSGIGVADGVAYESIAGILWKKKKLPYEAIDICQKIIAEYPKKEISGFEWNTTLDLEAIYNIRSIAREFALDTSYILAQLQNSADNSGFGAVSVNAYIFRAQMLLPNGLYIDAINELKFAVENFDDTRYTYYKTAVSYGFDALDLASQIYMLYLGDYNSAIEYCQTLINSSNIEDIKKGALYLKAQICDNSIGNRQDVIDAYSDAMTLANDSYVDYSSILDDWRSLSPCFAEKRIQEINNFTPETTTVTSSGATLFLMPIGSSFKIDSLSGGILVVALYDYQVSDTLWCKVQTADSVIGWIKGEFLNRAAKATSVAHRPIWQCANSRPAAGSYYSKSGSELVCPPKLVWGCPILCQKGAFDGKSMVIPTISLYIEEE
jgi:tetratricopeptide (TPR) repeat protein